MYNGQEKREYKRREKPYRAGLRVKQHEGHEKRSAGWDSVFLLNLSAGGALFFYNKDLEIGTFLDLKIDAPKAMLNINCVGKVTRIEQFLSTSMFCTAINFIGIGEQQEEETIYTVVVEALEQANKTSVA